MTIITLHVTPLTRQIMLAEYGPEPIQLPKKDIVLDYIRAATVNESGYKPRTLQWLSATIQIAVHEAMSRQAAQRNSNIGIALFNYHREVMLRYIDALHSIGYHASDAMAHFYQKYGLTEWDYSTEAAYRRWVDYKREKVKKPPIHVSQNKVGHLTLCVDDLLEKCETVISAYQQAKRIGVRLPVQLKYYVLYRYGKVTLAKAAYLSDCSSSAVHRGVLSMESRLKKDRLLSNLLRDVFPSPPCP